jgi:hypothetical protein
MDMGYAGTPTVSVTAMLGGGLLATSQCTRRQTAPYVSPRATPLRAIGLRPNDVYIIIAFAIHQVYVPRAVRGVMYPQALPRRTP